MPGAADELSPPKTPNTVARSHFQRGLHAAAEASLRPRKHCGYLSVAAGGSAAAPQRRWFELRDGVLLFLERHVATMVASQHKALRPVLQQWKRRLEGDGE